MLKAARVLTEVIWSHPANRGSRARALAKTAAWQGYKRIIGRPLDISAFGYSLRCYPDSHDASRMIYFNGVPDPAEMEFCKRYLRAGDRVIDAGANVGIYSLFFASIVGLSGSVLAFEPDPTNCARLRENVRRNGLSNIHVRETALADFHGHADFSQGADTGNTLYRLKTYNRPPQTVEVTTLDAELTGTFALCKMDIEGAEWDAFKGATKALADLNPPVWLIELSEKALARSGASVMEVSDWLKARGFSLWRYHDGLVPFVSADRKPGHVGDAIAIADSRLDEVRSRLG